MELKAIGRYGQLVELETGAIAVLFSCGAPIACHVKATGQCYSLDRVDRNRDQGYVTEQINSWLGDVEATPMPQDFFDGLLQPNYADMEIRREARL